MRFPSAAAPAVRSRLERGRAHVLVCVLLHVTGSVRADPARRELIARRQRPQPPHLELQRTAGGTLALRAVNPPSRAFFGRFEEEPWAPVEDARSRRVDPWPHEYRRRWGYVPPALLGPLRLGMPPGTFEVVERRFRDPENVGGDWVHEVRSKRLILPFWWREQRLSWSEHLDPLPGETPVVPGGLPKGLWTPGVIAEHDHWLTGAVDRVNLSASLAIMDILEHQRLAPAGRWPRLEGVEIRRDDELYEQDNMLVALNALMAQVTKATVSLVHPYRLDAPFRTLIAELSRTAPTPTPLDEWVEPWVDALTRPTSLAELLAYYGALDE